MAELPHRRRRILAPHSPRARRAADRPAVARLGRPRPGAVAARRVFPRVAPQPPLARARCSRGRDRPGENTRPRSRVRPRGNPHALARLQPDVERPRAARRRPRPDSRRRLARPAHAALEAAAGAGDERGRSPVEGGNDRRYRRDGPHHQPVPRFCKNRRRRALAERRSRRDRVRGRRALPPSRQAGRDRSLRRAPAVAAGAVDAARGAEPHRQCTSLRGARGKRRGASRRRRGGARGRGPRPGHSRSGSGTPEAAVYPAGSRAQRQGRRGPGTRHRRARGARAPRQLRVARARGRRPPRAHPASELGGSRLRAGEAFRVHFARQFKRTAMKRLLAVFALAAAPAAFAQTCPEKNLLYWQAFPAGGESDISARHQQFVLKKKCPSIETVIQYKPGVGGAVMWNQMNSLPGDGLNIVGINLPHIVLAPFEGQVQYKTEDITPTYWFHYTPDALVVPESSSIKTFQDFLKTAKEEPGKLTLGGSGVNSANHAAHERLNSEFGVKTLYVPFKGTGDMTIAVAGGHVSGAMSYTAFAINNKGKMRALAVAMDKRHPLLLDTPTFRELGVNWVDGAFRGIGMPKSTPPAVRKRMSDLWAALNNDPEMKELAAKSGFELVNIGVDQMDAFMKEKTRVYTGVAKQMGLVK